MTNRDERVRFTFRLPDELMNRLKQVAQERELSVNSLMLQILWSWCEKEL